jgi:predicted O-methyltransferase YrrM
MTIPNWFDGVKDNFNYVFLKNQYFKDKDIKMLQLGAFAGHASDWLGKNVLGTLIDVDTWYGSQKQDGHIDNHSNLNFNEVEEHHAKITNGLNVSKFKGTTKDFFKQNKETFDFIYIDASHKKKDVMFDLENSFTILNINGIIACDDYIWNINSSPELIPHYAIKEFVEKNKNFLEVLTIKSSASHLQLWFKKVKDENDNH